MSESEYEGRSIRSTWHQGARRPPTIARIAGTTVVASLLYSVTGSWSQVSTIAAASDGRPLVDVQIGGSASGWGELVILALGVVAFVLSRRSHSFRSARLKPGDTRFSADRLLRWMWIYVAAVWAFTILQAVVAVLLLEHQIVPPFLINGTVHIRHY